jgi:hypothetical protein
LYVNALSVEVGSVAVEAAVEAEATVLLLMPVSSTTL